MKLSILVPTLPEPRSQQFLQRLMHILEPQVARHPNDVEVIIDNTPRSLPTGTKRNNLIAKSRGEYFSQIDCDDTVPVYYVDELLKAIKFNPDVITFNGHMTTDGANQKRFVIKVGETYEERNGIYYRYPNHLCAFKKSVVSQVRFRPIWVQEDYHYATEIRDRKLLKSSIHLELDMYSYQFVSNKNPLSVKMPR